MTTTTIYERFITVRDNGDATRVSEIPTSLPPNASLLIEDFCCGLLVITLLSTAGAEFGIGGFIGQSINTPRDRRQIVFDMLNHAGELPDAGHLHEKLLAQVREAHGQMEELRQAGETLFLKPANRTQVRWLKKHAPDSHVRTFGVLGERLCIPDPGAAFHFRLMFDAQVV